MAKVPATPATLPDMRDMIKHALPNLMTSSRLSKNAGKDVFQSELHSPRTLRKFVHELAANASPSTSVTTSAKNWSVSNSLPSPSNVRTTDASARRRSYGDAVNSQREEKPATQKNSDPPSTFSLSLAAQGVFNAKALSQTIQNGRQERVGSHNSSNPESETFTQSTCEGECDSENSTDSICADTLESDAESDSMATVAEKNFACTCEKEEHSEQYTTGVALERRFHEMEADCELSATEKDIHKQFEVEKQNLTALFVGAKEQVEQLKQRQDQQSAHLLAEQRFRKEAEEEIARLRSKCEMQAEGTEEMRRKMNLIKEQMDMKCRVEKDRATKENLKLRCERAQLAKDKAKLQRELSHMAQLRSKGGHDRAKQGADNLAAKIADVECLPLRNCALEDKASLKKKLLLKWHPDKQPSPEQAVFATQVVQEMQNRSVWKD